MFPVVAARRSAAWKTARASSCEMPRRQPNSSDSRCAVSPSSTVSGVGGAAPARSAARRQWCSAEVGSVVPAHAAARACQRAASSVSPAALPVLGQQRRALVEAPGVLGRDRVGDGGVDGRAALAELRAVRDLLGQRVRTRRGPPGGAPARRRTRPRRAPAAPPRAPVRLQPGDALQHRHARTPCRSPRPPAAPPSRAGASRSMRADRTACTLAGTAASSTGPHEPVGAALALEVSRPRPAPARPPR